MTDWLKEYVDAIRDDIESSKQEVIRALEKHEETEMVQMKRMEMRLKDLETWKNKATLVLGALLVLVLASSPFAGAFITTIV